jgi:hypothetical protein
MPIFDLRMPIFDLRMPIFGFRMPIFDLRMPIFDLRTPISIFECRFSISECRFRFSNGEWGVPNADFRILSRPVMRDSAIIGIPVTRFCPTMNMSLRTPELNLHTAAAKDHRLTREEAKNLSFPESLILSFSPSHHSSIRKSKINNRQSKMDSRYGATDLGVR